MPFTRPFFRRVLNKKLKEISTGDQKKSSSKLKEVVNVISTGTKSLAKDSRAYWRIHSFLSHSQDWSRDCQGLAYKELELYLTFPSDLIRVLPTLLLSTLPFAQNVLFPIALLYPKKLLSSHFWNEEIKREVLIENYQIRIKSYHASFREFQSRLRRSSNHELGRLLYSIEQNVANSQSPNVYLLLRARDAFRDPRGLFSLSQLDKPYLRSLFRLHSISPFVGKSIDRYAAVLHQMDRALAREGIASLSKEGLVAAAVLRGFFSESQEDLSVYLDQWIQISLSLNERTDRSLLLHLPLFLSTNLPRIGE